MRARFFLWTTWALCLLSMMTACYAGYDLRASPSRIPAMTVQGRTTAAGQPTSPPGGTITAQILTQPRRQPLTYRFEYLPRLSQASRHGVGDVVKLSIEGGPLYITLSDLKEPADEVSELETCLFTTTMELLNAGNVTLVFRLADLFQGMTSSARRLDGGVKLRLETDGIIQLPAGGYETLDLLWSMEACPEDMRIWITVNMPIQEAGYVQLKPDGAIFSFRLSEIGQPFATPTPCVMAAKFIRETIDDNTPFAPGKCFEKTWVIANSGTCPWIEGSVWAHFSGDPMGVPGPLPLLALPEPGELLTITVPMTAPLAPGTYRGDWRLRSPSGDFYCRAFYLQIVVTTTLSGQPTKITPVIR